MHFVQRHATNLKKSNEYHDVETVLIIQWKMCRNRDKFDTPNTYMIDGLLSRFCIGAPLKRGRVKSALWVHTSNSTYMMRSFKCFPLAS